MITRQEFDARRDALFERLDANHDSYLAGDEFTAEPGGRRGHANHRRSDRMERGLDANHDGAITRDEFLARPLQMFGRLDRNGDGVISAEENQQARGDREARREHRSEGRRELADANHDGRVSRDEFRRSGEERFDRADANHDGRLTAEEREAARATREHR